MADNAKTENVENAPPIDHQSSNKKGGGASNDAPQNTEIQFNKSITIMADRPLPHLNKGTVKSFAAKGTNKVTTELFAMMCDKALTPRRTASIKYIKITNSSLVKLVAKGKVYWPPEKCEKYFFIFEHTLGKPIINHNEKYPAASWRAEDVIVNIAHPLINVLKNLRDKDIVHGQIWPGNMFYNGTAGAEKVTLGECLCAPASTFMPALYEPVERALADQHARGAGSLADDIYAFGVSLAVILRTSDPMKGQSDERIIEHKLEKGSYSTLLGRERLNGATLELLRGLLYDDPEQRWTLEDIEAWVDGRRLTPKQSPKRVNASRPLILADKKYTRPEILAKDGVKHVDEMARLVETGELSQWIDRAIEDKLIKVRTEQMIKDVASYDRSEGYNSRLVAAISVALYTECPVQYKSLRFLPSGFAKALSRAYIQKQDMQDYVDVLKYSFTLPSIKFRKNTGATSQLTKFDNARSFINQTKLNSGLERCIYFMDTECHCLSDIVSDYYVLSPEDLMAAFEDLCSKTKPAVLFDRHIVSFLSVKDRRNIDPYMMDLVSSERYKRILGQIRTLATIQKRSGLDKFPAIATWIASNLEDIYERFHDAKKKAHIEKTIDQLKKNGDLTKIALLFDDPMLFQGDVGNFQQAMEEYKRLEKEKENIQNKVNDNKDFGKNSGQQVASVVSMLVSFIIIVISTYFVVIKG